MDLSTVLAVLRRWSLTLIASALIAGLVAFVVASRIPPTYAAEAQVIVGPINTDRETLLAAQELVQTYAQLVTTDRILESVIERLDLDIALIDFRETVTSTAESVTRILTMQALAGDPDTATAIVNELTTALDELTVTGQIRPEGEVTVVTEARANPEPVQPQVPLIVVFAATAGLVAALTVVLLIDYLSNAVSGDRDLRRLSQAPFLGSVTPGGRFSSRPRQSLIVDAEPSSRAARAYRLIASRVLAGDTTASLRSVVVLGGDGNEGSGEVAANLAAVLAHAGRRVRLVDANDEDREVTRLFAAEPGNRLGDPPSGGEGLTDHMVHRAAPGLDVIPQVSRREARLRTEDQDQGLTEALIADADIVIVTTAPIQRSASAVLWARDADAAILVARRDSTKRDSVTSSAEMLRALGTPLLGAVLHAGSTRVATRATTGRDRRIQTGPQNRSAGEDSEALAPSLGGRPEAPERSGRRAQ